ncbi:MAG TPA: hypothetical protein PLH57_08620 [Oligoflexia bacterium]|nr:hypothetical protein [Oligoflexia bacterium]
MKRVRFTTASLVAGILLILFASTNARAEDFYVTSVVRDFPLSGNEKSPVDYYINAGSVNGLRKGISIEAIRKMPIYDNMNSKLMGDTSVKIARMKVIHVDKTYSVARLVKMYDKTETPLAGHYSVMIGDLIEVSEKQ